MTNTSLNQDLFEQASPYLVINEEQRKLTKLLRTARGQRFGKILKETYHSISPQLLSEARKIIAISGKLTLKDIVKLSIQFDLQLKHCFDFLSEPPDAIIPTGRWEQLQERNIKPTKLRQSILQEMSSSNAIAFNECDRLNYKDFIKE